MELMMKSLLSDVEAQSALRAEIKVVSERNHERIVSHGLSMAQAFDNGMADMLLASFEAPDDTETVAHTLLAPEADGGEIAGPVDRKDRMEKRLEAGLNWPG